MTTPFSRRALLAGLGGAALAGRAPAAGADDQSYFQMLVAETQDGKPPGLPPPWPGPRAELKQSPLYNFALPAFGIDNRVAFESLLARQKNARLEVPLAVVPGSSESLGHHTAWQRKLDGHWVEPEFRARLRHAYLLLCEENVHSVVISGGPIDPKAPGYDEGIYGFREMMDQYGKRWTGEAAARGEPLSARLIVDPWAYHSEINVRNGDRAALLAGLERNYVVTTAGTYKQGWWFVHHDATAKIGPILIRWGAFDGHCQSDLGYKLGAFGAMAAKGPFGDGLADHPDLPLVASYKKPGKPGDPFHTVVVAHWRLNPQVLQDPRWDIGGKQAPGPQLDLRLYQRMPG